MSQKPRHLKTPVQLWVADNRKRLGETPADLARLAGVTTDTARGWESRGSPGEDALTVLERHFGVPRPTVGAATVDTTAVPAALITALQDQTAAINRLVDWLSQGVPEPLRAAIAEGIARDRARDGAASEPPEPTPRPTPHARSAE